MKTLYCILFLFTVLILFSCKKEEVSVDMTKLTDYYFYYTDYFEYENDAFVKNDTMIYSFEYPNKIIGVRKNYIRSINGIDQFEKCDTVTKEYVIINENSIYFDLIEAGSYGLFDSFVLIDYWWEVLSIDETELKIKEGGYGNVLVLKCVKK